MRTEEEIKRELNITNILINNAEILLKKHFNINEAINLHNLKEIKSELLWILEDN